MEKWNYQHLDGKMTSRNILTNTYEACVTKVSVFFFKLQSLHYELEEFILKGELNLLWQFIQFLKHCDIQNS